MSQGEVTMTTLVHSTTLTVLTCYCGIGFAIPDTLWRMVNRPRDAQVVYCPLGHRPSWQGIRRDELQAARNEAARLADDKAFWKAEAEHNDRRRRSEKAAKTRIKNRVAAGCCPACNRTFQDLARHMKGKHPDFAANPGLAEKNGTP